MGLRNEMTANQQFRAQFSEKRLNPLILNESCESPVPKNLPRILSEAHTQQLREPVWNCHTGPWLEAFNFVTVAATRNSRYCHLLTRIAPLPMESVKCFSPPAR